MLKTCANVQLLWQNLPSQWSIKPLKYICLQSALYGANITSNAYDDYGVRFLRTTDIREDGTLEDQGVYIAEELVKDYLLSEGDLIISRSGTIGRAFLYSSDYGSCAYAGYLVRFILNSSQSSRYYFYITKSSPFQLWLSTSSIESTIGNVNGEKYANFLVPNPPLSEQKAIAYYLDKETAKIDELIKVKKRLLELLNEKRRALITHAVTRGLNPDVPMRDSGVEWIGEIPKHWGVLRLRRVLKKMDYGISESVGIEGKIGVLRMGDIAKGEINYDKIGFVDNVDNDLILSKDDLLFNRTNSLDQIGKVAIFRDNFSSPVSFASYLVRMRCNDSVIPEYLNYLLNSLPILTWARSEALPAIGQANLNPNRYSYVSIPRPPVEEQSKIIEYIKAKTFDINNLFVLSEKTIDLLQERRTSLITAAVTGQLKIME
jgi:type I restriction enzyme S subunit